MLVILAFLVQWPTLPAVVMAPLLMLAYVRLARREEQLMLERFDGAYAEYAARTPAFFSPPGRLWAYLMMPE